MVFGKSYLLVFVFYVKDALTGYSKNKEGIPEGQLKEIITLIWKWLKRKMMSLDYSLNLLNGSHILGCALVQNLYAKDVCLLVCWLDYVCFVAVELTILSWHVKGR